MARFLKTRTQSWSSVSSQATMDSSRPQSSEGPRPRRYDTGFPEPFCGTGNTTLRYPGADTSPNASISANDINIEQALRRSKRTFLAKHKHAVKYGKLNGEMPFSLISRPHTSSDLSSMDGNDSHQSKSDEYNRPSTSNSNSKPFDAPDSPPRRGLLRKFTARH